MAFSAKAELDGGAIRFAPEGRVDGETADAFTVALVAAAREAKAGGVELVVDLSALSLMISRGLRALTMAQREGVTVKLARPNAPMAEILRISRYDKLFEIVEA